MKTTLIAATIAFASMAAAANAAVINMTLTTAPAYNTQYNALKAAGATTQDFEGIAAQQAISLNTNVGLFESLGGTGSGSTCAFNAHSSGSTCTKLAVQQGAVNGQGNVAPLTGTKALSSNDGLGIKWTASLGGSTFSKLMFAVRDAADQGATFTVSAAGYADAVLRTAANGNIQMVMVDFGAGVTDAVIRMTSSRVNDAFTIDGIAVQPAPVPLPAAGLLLVGGLGALGALRKRKVATNV